MHGEADLEGLKNGVVLAELGGHGDGPFCGKHGAGRALVVMGTYIVDPGESVPYPEGFVFKPGRKSFDSYLAAHAASAKKSGAQVCVSVISTAIEDSIDFLKSAEHAKADFASLCAYSDMEMFTAVGLGIELLRTDNASLLREWCTGITSSINIPLIIKMGFSGDRETLEAIRLMKKCGVSLFHVVVGNAPEAQGLEHVGILKKTCPFLIIGGGIRDAAGAIRVLGAGADAVAVAAPVVKDPFYCGKLQREIKAGIKD